MLTTSTKTTHPKKLLVMAQLISCAKKAYLNVILASPSAINWQIYVDASTKKPEKGEFYTLYPNL